MKIDKLSLENFGIVENADFNFDSGFNVLSGPIGQGKTHVLRSIAHLLIDDKRKKLGRFIRWGADYYKCRGEFTHGGHTFDIDVAYKEGDSADRTLVIDGNDRYKGKDVTETLARYFDPALVRASVISYQGVVDVIESTESTRRENLKRIYDLDFSDKIKQLDKELDEAKQELDRIDGEILVLKRKEYDYKKLERLPLTEGKAEATRARIGEIDAHIATIEQEKKTYQDLKQRMNSVAEKRDVQSKKVKELQGKKRVQEKELAELREHLSVKNYEERLHQLESTKVTSNEDELQRQLDAIIVPDVKKVESLPIDEKQKEYNDIQVELSSSKKTLEACQNGMCPTCGKDFDSSDQSYHEGRVAELEESLAKVGKELQELKDKQEQQQKEKERQQQERADRLNEKQLLEQKIKNEQERIEQEKKNLQQQIEAECSSIEQTRAHDQERLANKEKEVENIQSSLTDAEELLSQYEAELLGIQEKLPAKEPTVDEEIKEERTYLQEKLQKYEAAKERNNAARKHNEELKAQEEADTKQLEAYREERDAVSEELSTLETAKDILRKEFPNYVISQTVKDLERRMNGFLTRAYPRYTVTLKDGKNGLSILYGPNEEDVSEASGGEKDVFNLALKVAFSQLSGLRMLMLDEVDKFHDVSTASTEFAIVHDLLQSGDIEQVFVVTHKDEIKDLLESDYDARVFELSAGEVV